MSRFHEKAEGDERSGQHSDQGILKDEKAEEQPKDKERAQTVHTAEPRRHGLPTKKNAEPQDKAEKRRTDRR